MAVIMNHESKAVLLNENKKKQLNIDNSDGSGVDGIAGVGVGILRNHNETTLIHDVVKVHGAIQVGVVKLTISW